MTPRIKDVEFLLNIKMRLIKDVFEKYTKLFKTKYKLLQ